MARIADAEIERLKSEISLAELVRDSGIELRAVGENLSAKCLWHNDENPSLIITPAKNLFHCFGCGVAGSVIDWVMKYEQVSFRHAIEMLKQRLPDRTIQAAKPLANVLTADQQSTLNEVVAYYHTQIAEARSYLESRGLDDAELINKFQLGFSNRTLGYFLPDKQLKAGRESRARLTEIGLLRESGHEHFAGSLTIPVFDESGNVTEVYGRKVTPNLRKGTPIHLYLKGKHRGVWNWQGLINTQEVILCEALIDALTIYKAGFHNVTSSYGVNGFTQDHLAAFKKYNIKRVLIAYDRDEAGDRAAQELADRLSAENIECLRIGFPINTDANEFARQYQPTKERWLELIAQARPLNEINQSIRSINL